MTEIEQLKRRIEKLERRLKDAGTIHLMLALAVSLVMLWEAVL